MIAAKYVTVWDGGTIVRTNCVYDPDLNYVGDIETADIEGLDLLEDEYVELPSGDVVRNFITENTDLDGDDALETLKMFIL